MNQQLQKLEQPKSAQLDASEFDVMVRTATMLVKTNFLPASIKTAEQAVAIILTGRELGIGTMAALNTINVIQNKPTISPQLMLALIERSGQLENIEITANGDHVVCTMKRRNRTAHSERFGNTEAKAMGLDGKDNYKKQALTMYKWRAVAACARVVFPDVILGLYSPEEMGADVNDEGEIIAPARPAVAMPVVTPVTEQQANAALYAPNKAGYTEAELDDTIEAKKKEVGTLCRSLNAAGDMPKWTASRITDYVNELFEVENGVDDLTIGSFDALIDDLTIRLVDLKNDDGGAK